MNLVVYLELIGGFEGAGICPLNKDKTFKKIDIAKAVEGRIGGFEGAGICPLNKDKTFKKIDIAKAVEGKYRSPRITFQK
ncbi:hypothetical protein QE152_g9532 [Popillia japonica]|uniref:Uncharacterized protein n=1 Tax=Popillia japonica TaxID=7064 RepID=A0AAW1LYU8_POPJA